jgi:hypothetical protein
MWSTVKLWRRFRTYDLNQYGFYSVARPENVIILRDGKKYIKGVGFVMKPAIRRLRDDLEQYNEFVDKHDITVNLNGDVQVSTEFLAKELYSGFLKGAALSR